MDATLSQVGVPPLDSEFTLSQQLPFFLEDRVDDLPLPPTPPSACNACWEGPLPWYFGSPCVLPRGGKRASRWPQPFSYLVSLAKLQSRADTGCVWCRFILHMARDHKLEKNNGLIVTVRGREQKRAGQRYQTLYVDINGVPCFEGVVYTASDDPAAPYIATWGPILDIGSRRALALAREHIDKCIHGHTRCKSAASPGLRLPARLVDCTSLSRPRLVATIDGERGEYLALSYVWGGDQIHKTTKSNISTYEQGIPPSLLPATIRDAIRVTHMLGFRLLWVDSLCIIQDSEEDKLHEIGHMHHIYRYAHLTIMAGSAEGASEGFLHRRPPPEHDIALPCIFLPHHLTSVGCWDDSLVTKSQVGQVYFASISSTRRSYSDELGRMATRAWCLQEYLLSPRTLLFTPRTVLFRCLTATQAVGNDSPCFIVDDLQLPKTLFLRDPPVAEPGSKEWKDMRTAWMKVVEDYSGRTVGVESDKLVACAAVAEQFRRALDSAYLAGLWSSDMFLVDLLWETVKDSPKGATRQHTRPRTYRAPSWSWAAVDGVVRQCPHASYLEDTQAVALVNIMECGVVLEDAALPFGRVLDGALWLRGRTICCDCHPVGARASLLSRHPGPGRTSYRIRVAHDENLGVYHYDDAYASMAWSALIVMDCNEDVKIGRIWLLPFVCRIGTSAADDSRVVGLVLSSVARDSAIFGNRRAKFFRRIGVFTDVSPDIGRHVVYLKRKEWAWVGAPSANADKLRDSDSQDMVIL